MPVPASVLNLLRSKVAAQLSYRKQGGTMTEREILEKIKKLPAAERLMVVEETLRSIREELDQIERPMADTDLRRKLTAAARALLPDYEAGGDLTAFTTLDGEDFHAAQ
jgi:hypothetical protein